MPVPQFSEELLEKIRNAVDIVDYIGKRIELKQTGRNYVGLCPFHQEKTPSFNVNSVNQLYYCFGCGRGGNIFNFVMATEGVAFPEAVQILAKQAGIELPNIPPERKAYQEKHEKLYQVNHLAAQYYYRTLRSEVGKLARSYLIKRAINGSLARNFYLGYATTEWNGLLNFLNENGIPVELAEEAGLVSQGKNGYYDRFRNRIIFPILDYRGRFIGFGGRIIGDGQPKYLNSPETPIFQKNRVLYGINWARQSIREKDSVVVVEGYTDCISLSEKGITNVVASLGTAFSQQHAELLSRFTKNVIIAFDGDAAGARATLRGLEVLNKAGLNVKIANLTSGMDPDQFARTHTLNEVEQWLADALPYIEFLIKKTISEYDLQSHAGKIAASKEIISILIKLDSAIDQYEYGKYAAKLLLMDENVLLYELRQAASANNAQETPTSRGKFLHIEPQNRYTIKDLPPLTSLSIDMEEPDYFLETNIMRLLLDDSSLLEEMLENGLDADCFTNLDYRHLFNLLSQGNWDKHGEAVAEKLFALPVPAGSWNEYLQQFKICIWNRALNKIEENLVMMENDSESDFLIKLGNLIKHYYRVRRDIFLIREKGNLKAH